MSIGDALDVTPGAVSQWLKRAREGGVEALRDHPAPGAQPKLTAEELDLSTGLYSYGARYYNCGTGLFAQPDSIVPEPADPQSLNRFSYCRNNPLRYTDPTGQQEEEPYYIFVGGYGTTADTNRGDWAPMVKNLGLKGEGIDYGFFEWESGWSGQGTASIDRSTADAAPELARQVGNRKNVTLVGHSKGGALIMEYLAQIAEKQISPNSNLKYAFTIDSPLGNNALTDAAPFQRYTNLGPLGGPVPARDVRDRLAGLPERLAQRGMAVNITSLDNPNDWIGHNPITGIPHVSISLGDTWSGHKPERFGGAAIAAHGLLMNSPIAAGVIRGKQWGAWW